MMLIAKIRTPHEDYCLASFIKIDPLVDATTQLFPLKLMLVDGHVQLNPPNLSYSTISWMLVQS